MAPHIWEMGGGGGGEMGLNPKPFRLVIGAGERWVLFSSHCETDRGLIDPENEVGGDPS
jgi:hypothetical protein